MDSMNIQIFESNNFGKIRVVQKDGEPWFVAVDVCKALDLDQVTRALDRLDDDECTLLKVTHPQNPEKDLDMNCISEAGLYGLILSSRKPEAKAFKRWIKHDVLPQIRLTGSYRAKYALSDILEANKMIMVGLKDNQLYLAMDKIYQRHMGYSALTAAGIQLKTPELEQLLTPTEIGERIKQFARVVNALLLDMGYQRKVGKSYEPVGEGKVYGVMLDVGKMHSSGTPVRQLKWKSSILDVL